MVEGIFAVTVSTAAEDGDLWLLDVEGLRQLDGVVDDVHLVVQRRERC